MSEPSSMGADLVAALASLADPVKDGKVNTGRMSYTFLSLSQLLNTARTTLGAHNLAVMQWPERTDDGIQVHTSLIHTSGQQMDFAPLGIRCTPDAQSVGSAVTYARRYALAAILGLAGADDDDGHHATNTVTRHQQTADEQLNALRLPDPYREEPPITGGAPAMSQFTADMPASQKQVGAIKGICRTLGVGEVNAKDFATWVLRREAPDRPDDIALTKGDASHVIEQLQGDAGKDLASEYLGTML